MDDVSNFVRGFYKFGKNLIKSPTENDDASAENSNSQNKSIVYGKIFDTSLKLNEFPE